jgi:L-threonylcarbamoyladenylate synthase
MQTLRLDAADAASIPRAAEIIRSGGLVAFPTETVYGLGANALDAAAVRKIFAAKERPAWDPVIVHLASREMLSQVVTEVPVRFHVLADRFMPGPLTLLLQKHAQIPSEVTAGRQLVGIRIPAHETAQRLIASAGVPIAAPSANRFGRISPTTAEHVLADLDGRIDAVLDGGTTRVGLESTVLDLSTTPATILREGGVTREQLEAVIGRVQTFARLVGEVPPEGLPSPGLGVRHYAPRARLMVVEGNESALAAAARNHPRAGLMLPSGWQAEGAAFDWGHWGDWPALAARLYAGLRSLDARDVDVIIAPLPPNEGLGSAIRDRLQKAAKGDTR